jgi:hypothetical protein
MGKFSTILRWTKAIILFSVCFLIISGTKTDAQENKKTEHLSLIRLKYIQVSPSGVLRWYGLPSIEELPIEIGSIGKIGDHLAPGNWRMSGVTEPGFIHVANDGIANWNIRSINNEPNVTFTLGKNLSTVVSGADLDGNNIGDAISVSSKNGRLQWDIIVNPGISSSELSLRTIYFGKEQDKPFFFAPQYDTKKGARDAIAVVRGNSILYRFIDSKTVSRIPLRRSWAQNFTQVPEPLKRRTVGRDSLVFQMVSGENTQFVTATSSANSWGRVRWRRTTPISTKGIVVVGDYLADEEGEEVAIRDVNEGLIQVKNLFTGASTSVFAPAGILFDSININVLNRIDESHNPSRITPSPLKWPECPKFDDIRGGFLVLPGKNFPSVKVVLPVTFTALTPATTVKVYLIGPSSRQNIPFDSMANPDPVLLRAHYTHREDCKVLKAKLGTSTPQVLLKGEGQFIGGNQCLINLEQGKTLCDRND